MELLPVFFNPFPHLGNIHFSLGNRKTQLHKFILRIGKRNAVPAQDQQHGSYADSFVAVDKAVILRQATANSRSFANHAGMGFNTAKGGIGPAGGRFRSAPDRARHPIRRSAQSIFYGAAHALIPEAKSFG